MTESKAENEKGFLWKDLNFKTEDVRDYGKNNRTVTGGKIKWDFFNWLNHKLQIHECVLK